MKIKGNKCSKRIADGEKLNCKVCVHDENGHVEAREGEDDESNQQPRDGVEKHNCVFEEWEDCTKKKKSKIN